MVSRRRPILSKTKVYPRSTKAFDDLEGLVDEYLFSPFKPPVPFIRPGDKVVTMGSCFAENIGQALAEQQVDVTVNRLHEEANRPHDYLALLDYLLKGNLSSYREVFERHVTEFKRQQDCFGFI